MAKVKVTAKTAPVKVTATIPTPENISVTTPKEVVTKPDNTRDLTRIRFA